jgi:integrase
VGRKYAAQTAIPIAAKNTEYPNPKGTGFHAFRHAHAVLMDRLSVPMKVRQQRLGHGDASITLGIHTHAVG